jgi:hypothetical protein
MKKPHKVAALALGLSLGLAGLGPAALAQRDFEEPDEPEIEAAGECSVEQTNDSDNSTGNSTQAGLINVNNVALQGLNVDLLGNLLCQGVFANDIVAGVLAIVGIEDGDGDPDAADAEPECSVEQTNDSTNSTGTNEQAGLINVNNLVLQGINLDILGNGLCGSNFLNDLTVGILGSGYVGDGDDADDAAVSAECSTEQDNTSDNETGTSVVTGGLLNLNNIALQGDNVAVLSNGLCGSIFLNDILVSILGLL